MIQIQHGHHAVAVQVGGVQRAGAGVAVVDGLEVFLLGQRVQQVVELGLGGLELFVEGIEPAVVLAGVAAFARPDQVVDALYLVAGGAALVYLERLGDYVLALYVLRGAAIDAGLLPLDELQVLAHDVGPDLFAALELPERLLDEAVSLLLGLPAIGALERAASDDLGVLEEDLVLNGLNVAVRHIKRVYERKGVRDVRVSTSLSRPAWKH